MKKIYLLFGIVAFSGAWAQQKDLFDIQKHLQKKQVEENLNNEINKLMLPPDNKNVNLYSGSYLSNIQGLSFLLPNGDKVNILPKDNMPCIVPDMNAFQKMPNVKTEKDLQNKLLPPPSRIPGQIPNGALPLRMIVSK